MTFACDGTARLGTCGQDGEAAGLVPEAVDDGYTFDRVGRWWHQEQEVDVVGLTTGETMVAGECKFTSQPMGYDGLHDLESDVEDIRWTPQGGGAVTHAFCLFSRSGFNRSLIEAAEERDDLRLFSVADVVKWLGTPSPVCRLTEVELRASSGHGV